MDRTKVLIGCSSNYYGGTSFTSSPEKWGARLFHRYGINPDQPNPPKLSSEAESFEKWKLGKTDDDFVNANMNELEVHRMDEQPGEAKCSLLFNPRLWEWIGEREPNGF